MASSLSTTAIDDADGVRGKSADALTRQDGRPALRRLLEVRDRKASRAIYIQRVLDNCSTTTRAPKDGPYQRRQVSGGRLRRPARRGA
jgi:hypothetical protein